MLARLFERTEMTNVSEQSEGPKVLRRNMEAMLKVCCNCACEIGYVSRDVEVRRWREIGYVRRGGCDFIKCPNCKNEIRLKVW